MGLKLRRNSGHVFATGWPETDSER
jgi:hypothetical protein